MPKPTIGGLCKIRTKPNKLVPRRIFILEAFCDETEETALIMPVIPYMDGTVMAKPNRSMKCKVKALSPVGPEDLLAIMDPADVYFHLTPQQKAKLKEMAARTVDPKNALKPALDMSGGYDRARFETSIETEKEECSHE